jgi:hypothetical protein
MRVKFDHEKANLASGTNYLETQQNSEILYKKYLKLQQKDQVR